jgi:hypothetical protein
MGRETNRQRRERQSVTAREKAKSARVTAQRHQQRRRAMVILSSVVAVVVVVAVIAVVAINGGSGKNTSSGNRRAAPPALVTTVTSVPAEDVSKVIPTSSDVGDLKAISDTPLSANGLPEVLFVGAEFCPYCAAERWGIVQALSRFGTFTNLSVVKSSSTDVYPNTPTFSFYGSNYSSKYLAFVPVENEDRAGKPLQTLTAAQQSLFSKYAQGYPFLDIANKYVDITPPFPSSDLDGMTWQDIADQLATPSSKVAKDILGEANTITAGICSATGNEPATVCSTPSMTATESHLGG